VKKYLFFGIGDAEHFVRFARNNFYTLFLSWARPDGEQFIWNMLGLSADVT